MSQKNVSLTFPTLIGQNRKKIIFDFMIFITKNCNSIILSKKKKKSSAVTLKRNRTFTKKIIPTVSKKSKIGQIKKSIFLIDKYS